MSKNCIKCGWAKCDGPDLICSDCRGAMLTELGKLRTKYGQAPYNCADKWCRHRTAYSREIKVCKAGVDFHQWQPSGSACSGETEAEKKLCPQYSPSTEAELIEKENRFHGCLERMGMIRGEILLYVEQTKQRSGTLGCPACKTGTVRFSQASNRHIRAACSTPDCASWME